MRYFVVVFNYVLFDIEATQESSFILSLDNENPFFLTVVNDC